MLRRPGKVIEFLLHDALFRHSAVLFLASACAMVGDVGFQMISGRMLSQKEYALMATFLAFFALVNRPAGTLAVAMNHYVALLEKDGRHRCIGRLLVKWLLLAGGGALALSMAIGLFSSQIAASFHLERSTPIIVSALVLPAIIISPVLVGSLRGLQRFGWVSAVQIGTAFGRLLFALVFLVFIATSCGWALAGHVTGLYIALGIALFPLLYFFRLKSKGGSLPKLPSLRLYLLKCSIIQLGFSVLVTGDIIIVKYYLPESDGFAYAATLSRMVSLMAAAIGGSMMPKVASAQVFTSEHRALYLRSMLYTVIAVLGSLAFCLFIPQLLLALLFGEAASGAEVVGYTRGMALAMAPSTLLGINVGLLLSQRRFKMLVVVIACAMGYLVSASIWHASAVQIIWISGLTNFLGLAVTTFGILRSGNAGMRKNGTREVAV